MRSAAIAVLLLLPVGCGSNVISAGSSDVIIEGTPVDDPYDGPLYVRVSEPDHPNPLVRSGAAGKALECSVDPYGGSTGRNGGVTSGHDNPVEALAGFIEDGSVTLPVRGYRTEREAQDRVLFSYDVEGETKISVIVADGVTAGHGESGWSMETFAQCDPAELPSAVTDELGIQIWVNEKGERVPTTVIRSSQGPEHCAWHSATFLDLRGDTFIKDPQGVLPPEWFDVTFDSDVTLPQDAEDTGYRLDGQTLWLAGDQSAAYVVTGPETERWPAATKFLGCA